MLDQEEQRCLWEAGMIPAVPAPAMALAHSRHREQAQVRMALDDLAQVQVQKVPRQAGENLLMLC